jgi:hypothetical protein
VTGHKTAQAAPTTSGDRSVAGLLFSGWCREGWWSPQGVLLRGKDARQVNISKFLRQPHPEAHRLTPRQQMHQVINQMLDSAARSSKPLLTMYEIPVFMESHL